jgi:hypothetical protein
MQPHPPGKSSFKRGGTMAICAGKGSNCTCRRHLSCFYLIAIATIAIRRIWLNQREFGAIAAVHNMTVIYVPNPYQERQFAGPCSRRVIPQAASAANGGWLIVLSHGCRLFSGWPDGCWLWQPLHGYSNVCNVNGRYCCRGQRLHRV